MTHNTTIQTSPQLTLKARTTTTIETTAKHENQPTTQPPISAPSQPQNVSTTQQPNKGKMNKSAKRRRYSDHSYMKYGCYSIEQWPKEVETNDASTQTECCLNHPSSPPTTQHRLPLTDHASLAIKALTELAMASISNETSTSKESIPSPTTAKNSKDETENLNESLRRLSLQNY